MGEKVHAFHQHPAIRKAEKKVQMGLFLSNRLDIGLRVNLPVKVAMRADYHCSSNYRQKWPPEGGFFYVCLTRVAFAVLIGVEQTYSRSLV